MPEPCAARGDVTRNPDRNRIQHPGGPARRDTRRGRTPAFRMNRVSITFITCLLFSSSGCALLGPPVLAPELISQDYYFVGSYVQIQGEADLPPVRQLVTAKSADGANKTTVEFLSLRERRKQCRQNALQQSHAKWLSLTRRDRQAQSEWDLRLSMGGSGNFAVLVTSSQVSQTRSM